MLLGLRSTIYTEFTLITEGVNVNIITVAYRQRDVSYARCTLSRWMATSLHSKVTWETLGYFFVVLFFKQVYYLVFQSYYRE